MATVTYNASLSWTDVMGSNDLNSMANNAGVLTSITAVDNTTNRHLYADIAFTSGGSVTLSAVGCHLAIYLLPVSADGTNYPNAASGSTASDYPAMTYFVGAIGFRNAPGTMVGVLEGVRISPTKYKPYVVNKTGNTLSASSNTLKMTTYTESVA